MKSLLPPDFHGTILQAFRRIKGRNQIELELEHEGKRHLNYSAANSELGYLQLWLFAMRHFPEITGVQPRKDMGQPSLAIQGSERYWCHSLGCLALRSGFNSKEITHLSSKDPAPQMIRDFLFRVRPKELFDHNEHSVINEIHRSLIALDSIQRRNLSPCDPLYSTDVNTTLELPDRCGRPFGQSFLNDKKFLFLDYIYPHLFNKRQVDPSKDRRRHITSFTVKKDTFISFFGDLCNASAGEDASGLQTATPKAQTLILLQTTPVESTGMSLTGQIERNLPQTSIPSENPSNEDTKMSLIGHNERQVPQISVPLYNPSDEDTKMPIISYNGKQVPLQITFSDDQGTSDYNPVHISSNLIMNQRPNLPIQLNYPIQIPLSNSIPTILQQSNLEHPNMSNDFSSINEDNMSYGWIRDSILDKTVNEIEFLRMWHNFQPSFNTEKPFLRYSTADRAYGCMVNEQQLIDKTMEMSERNFLVLVLDIRSDEPPIQNEVYVKHVSLAEMVQHVKDAGRVIIF